MVLVFCLSGGVAFKKKALLPIVNIDSGAVV